MTAEVAILNRAAVALAADSATTVMTWPQGQKEERYFKGANKIFHISQYHPIGAMIYGAADLNAVPWETIIKTFRGNVGATEFDHLSDCSKSFFEFLSNFTIGFPRDVQDRDFMESAKSAAFFCYLRLTRLDEVKSAMNVDAKKPVLTRLLDELLAAIKAKPLLHNAQASDVEGALSRFGAKLEEDVKNSFPAELVAAFDLPHLAEVAIRSIFSNFFDLLQRTGLVFAGFGSKEIYPRMETYECLGLVLGKPLFAAHPNIIAIGSDCISHIEPFATTSMADTFIRGASFDTYSEIRRAFEQSIIGFEAQLRTELNVDAQRSFEGLRKKSSDDFVENFLKHLRESHLWPMLRVVEHLPIDEMAILAETLVSIESLKERVTRPSQSVSGPIDVAVISKGDGFIWIKRKHYVDSKLNFRFFDRERKRQ